MKKLPEIISRNRNGLLLLLFVIILIITLFRVNSQRIYYKEQLETNSTALTDSIIYIKTKNNELVATKTMLTGDLKTLKLINDSLYNIIKKNIKKPSDIIYIKTTVTDTTKRDTIFIHRPHTLKHDFMFCDRWSRVGGFVESDSNHTRVAITENTMQVDFSIVQHGNKVSISSNNPYIKYNNIIGIKNEQKKERYLFGIGPEIGVGINTDGRFVPYVGIGLHYNLFQWGKF